MISLVAADVLLVWPLYLKCANQVSKNLSQITWVDIVSSINCILDD